MLGGYAGVGAHPEDDEVEPRGPLELTPRCIKLSHTLKFPSCQLDHVRDHGAVTGIGVDDQDSGQSGSHPRSNLRLALSHGTPPFAGPLPVLKLLRPLARRYLSSRNSRE